MTKTLGGNVRFKARRMNYTAINTLKLFKETQPLETLSSHHWPPSDLLPAPRTLHQNIPLCRRPIPISQPLHITDIKPVIQTRRTPFMPPPLHIHIIIFWKCRLGKSDLKFLEID